MEMFLFRPEDYEDWSAVAIKKIRTTIDSCLTESHLDAAKAMVDHFTLMMALNETYPDSMIQDISRQLYLYLNIKKTRINAPNQR